MNAVWRRIFILALVTLALALVGGVSAQSAVDPALLDYVASAFAQTAAVDSLHIEAQSLTETAAAQGSTFGAVIASSYDLVRSGDAWNVSGKQTTTSDTPNGSFESVTETIVIDGTIYMRIQRSGDATNAAPQGGQALPEGWFDLSALQTDAQGQGQPGVGAFLGREGSPSSSLLSALLAPVTADSLTALSELPSDAIDGQTMRVFQVSFDSQAILVSDAASLVRGGAVRGGIGFGGAPPGGFAPGGADNAGNGQFTPGQQGQLPESTPQFAAPPEIDPATVSVSFAVYVGEDGLIHRIYGVVATAGDSGAGFSTSTTTVTDFSAFNQPVAISAPAIGT